jgi:hypothetical protein
MHEPRIGLDLRSFTGFVDTLHALRELTGAFAEDRKALAHIFFYVAIPYLPQAVIAECAKLPKEQRELYEKWIQVNFPQVPAQDQAKVDARTEELLRHHTNQTDCRTLAEAEVFKLDALLTYDADFTQRLGSGSASNPQVKVITPRAYWADLAVPHDAPLKHEPDWLNPLRGQSWWRW